MMRPLVLVALLLGFCHSPAWAAEAPHRPLVVILVPGTDLTDWRTAQAPMLHQIMATGSLAVMNTRTARLPDDHRRETPESAALTLGAGSRAAGGGEITEFQPVRQRAPGTTITYGTLYTRRMGVVPSPHSEVNALWPKVLRENSGQGYDLRPGNLGDGLARHGIPLCVGGGRFALPVACDSDGTVASPVEHGHLPDRLPPVLVWDSGSDIASTDALVHKAAMEVLAEQGRLIIVSPFVSDGSYARGARLAPVVVWGPGVPAGLLVSPSTHRAGLVTNTDFAPSVAAYLGASEQRPWLPTAAFGRPWEFRSQRNSVVIVTRLEDAAGRQARALRVLPFTATCLGLLMIGAMVCTRQAIPCPPLMWLPGIVVFALLVSPSVPTAGLWIAALSLVFLQLQSRLGVTRLIDLTAALTVLVLVGDTLSGSTLMRVGLLGYSAVEGARYYGIGNEAMGALIGSALVAANALWRRGGYYRAATVLMLVGLTLLLGLPSAGAKAGGVLVAVAAFGAFLWTAWGKRWDARVILSILAAMVFMLALMTATDWHHHSGSQSHVGGAVQRILSGGMREAVDIIQRKLAVESRLIYHSTWALPLWVCLVGLSMRANRVRKSGGQTEKALVHGSAAALLVCLAANDAGVVAAALCGIVVMSRLSSTPPTDKKPPSDSTAV